MKQKTRGKIKSARLFSLVMSATKLTHANSVNLDALAQLTHQKTQRMCYGDPVSLDWQECMLKCSSGG